MCPQALTLCSAPDTKRVGDCLQVEDLTTMAHMEGSNPVPTRNAARACRTTAGGDDDKDQKE